MKFTVILIVFYLSICCVNSEFVTEWGNTLSHGVYGVEKISAKAKASQVVTRQFTFPRVRFQC